ncbi:hypothetical protein CEXT_792961 [Caerostris extrusa]|uniref:Uncharacterized protein n=1 Tax=Caerostris extrusa TaxID=172846 RepID=A0AAV4T2R5_CAEEX|nr:hypothetical protein CEXT_792961 [Caerostris extrusa]
MRTETALARSFKKRLRGNIPVPKFSTTVIRAALRWRSLAYLCSTRAPSTWSPQRQSGIDPSHGFMIQGQVTLRVT